MHTQTHIYTYIHRHIYIHIHTHTPTTHIYHMSSRFVLGTDLTQHIYISPHIHIPHYIHPTHHAHIPRKSHTPHTQPYVTIHTLQIHMHTLHTLHASCAITAWTHYTTHTYIPPHMYHTSIPHITYTHTTHMPRLTCTRIPHTHTSHNISHMHLPNTHVYILCLSPNWALNWVANPKRVCNSLTACKRISRDTEVYFFPGVVEKVT